MADTDDTILSGPVAAVANNLGVEYVVSFRFGGSGMLFEKKKKKVRREADFLGQIERRPKRNSRSSLELWMAWVYAQRLETA